MMILFGPIPAALSQHKEDPAHEELRALMREVLADYNAGDLDKLIATLDDNVVVTWQNGKVNVGPKAVKEYILEMTKGPKRIVEKSTIEPEADELSHLYNDGKTAIAWGKSRDHYVLTDGTEFDQDTRWSATAIKKGAQWKAASIHISTNMFDNPILHLAIRRTATWVGGLAGGGSLLLGLIGGYFIFRKRGPRAASTS
jgi:hypothetical protein